ncbi:MAG: hypothetical protein GFH24_608346n30 [Chloroflexi bacterium AL-N5]|nr:hypothetical protein [Chloroflexi bacterium AL-N5]
METTLSMVEYEAPMVELPADTDIVAPVVWYVVAIAILVGLGVTLALGIAAYCVIRGHRFVVQWFYTPNKPGYVSIGCSG